MTWLRLYKLNNCFNDKSKTHLGLKYKGKWYCITHLNTDTGVLIKKYNLKMPVKSDKDEYLKRIITSAPNVITSTNLKIRRSVLLNYDKYKLDNLENKRKRYNESKTK